MVVVAQLVRASDCGSEGRGFESPQPPFLLLKLPSGRAPVVYHWHSFNSRASNRCVVYVEF